MVELLLGDSREILKKFPDGYFDIIITDPPYEGENKTFFELEDELWRVLKDDTFLIFWWSVKRIPEIALFKRFRYYWEIIVEFYSTFSKSFLGDRCYAPIFVFAKGKPKVKYRSRDILVADELPIIQSKVKSQYFKPTLTQTLLLMMFTKEGDKVLDPFVGFGSLAMVCKLFNRDFVGIEIDEKRYQIACHLVKEMKVVKSIPEMLSEYD